MLGSCGAFYIVYFLFIIFFGSFYLINLVLAVVAISYEQEVLDPQEKKAGVPDLDGSGDEASFNEDDDKLDGDENEGALVEAGALAKKNRGFCGALKACCCCCTSTPEKVVVDPENGNMVSMGPTVERESCWEKFIDVWFWFRSHLKSFIYCFWFENGIMLCIIVNTLCLALDSPSISSDIDEVLSKINDVIAKILSFPLY